MPTIEYSKVVGGGAGWTKVSTPDGRTMTVKGDRAVRNNNPGNLMAGPFADSMGAIGNDFATKSDRRAGRHRGFAVFATREDGIKAQAGWYAKEAKKHPDLTIGQAISKYAPSFENNTKAYTNALTKAGGITADTKLSDISPEQMQSVLSAQHAVEGNTRAVAYDADTGAKIATLRPSAIEPTQVATAAPAAPAQGLLASMLGDPLGLQAQAAEAPPPGLAAYAPDAKATSGLYGGVPQPEALTGREARLADTAPSGDVGWSVENTIGKALGLVPDAAASNFPSRPAQVASNTMRPGVQVAETPADIERMTVEQAAATAAPQAPDASRIGAPAADRFAPGLQAPRGPVSPENYASVLSPQEQAAPAPAPALSAPKNVRDYNVAPANMASTSPEAMAPSPDYAGLTPNMAQGMPRADYAAKFGALDPTMAPNSPEISALAYGPDAQTIADPNAEIGPQGQTISGDFPPAPEDSMFGPVSKAALTGLLTGGPIGGLLGAASGMLSGGLGSLGGGPAGMASDAESYNAGSGLGGMQQGINGPRGATGYSRSNPGTFSRSRGFGLGSDLTNQYGYRTTYGPDGSIRANSGTMDAWGRVLGGLFDRLDKSKKGQSGRGLGGLSQATHDAIGKGLGGLY